MTTSTVSHHSAPAQLALEVVGADRTVVAAIGAFTAASFDDVAIRLARLISTGRTHLQIECSRATSMAPEIVELFTRASETLAARGGVLELTGVPPGSGGSW